MKPQTLILRTAGTNCDAETAHAFELAGSEPRRIHLNRVLERPGMLDEFQILAIPGGFSYGDDIAAGRIFANQIVHHLREALERFVRAGKPVIGICNGFQVLVKTDLLPGPVEGQSGQLATLTNNDSGKFVDRWITVTPQRSRCIWTRGLERIEIPVAHGEGKFIPADDAVRRALWSAEQIALTYVKPDGSPAGGAFPENPNGSVDDIAGICDSSGLILGLMPHPERFVRAFQHPAWTRRVGGGESGAGLRVFENAVQHVQQGVGAGF
jgi:phosphoribosylformylglycinamidine synthase